MGRSPCCSSSEEGGVKKGPWSQEEDELLVDYVNKNGPGNWQSLPKRAGLNRCGKSCRLRWTNYLRPDIKRGPFSQEEEAIIISLHRESGNKWSRIAACLPGRTDNEIKNYWNTHLRKRLLRSGIDPKTHRQISDLDLLFQLLSNSDVSSLITPLSPHLGLHGNANGHMVTNFQYLQSLQNLFQLINSSPLPYLQPPNYYSQLNFNGLMDGNLFQPHNILQTLINENRPSTSNSLQSCDMGELSPDDQGLFVNNTTTGIISTINSSDDSLPTLVSATPESSINNVNPPQSTKESSDHMIPTEASFESDIFDSLENFLDDEATTSFLKDIVG
ncbi:hypothetical protein M9H77_00630 [Catharanthus roseus]|nr:hypothetical protein M9H77_00630 [Catharanthus roseus]